MNQTTATNDGVYDFAILPATGDARVFNEIFDIYVASIPASERKDRDALARMTQSQRYRVHVAEHAGRIAAFGVVYHSEHHDFALLEYFATSPLLRNQGIGGRLLDHILAAQGDTPMLLEVEAPPPADHSGDSMENRRIGFYRRHGVRMIEDFGYVLPLKTVGTPPPMVILVGAAKGLTSVPLETLRRWLGDIYENVYGVARASPDFQAMFRNETTAFTIR